MSVLEEIKEIIEKEIENSIFDVNLIQSITNNHRDTIIRALNKLAAQGVIIKHQPYKKGTYYEKKTNK